MGFFVFVCWMAVMPVSLPREDPTFRPPSGARFQNVSEWGRLLSQALSNQAFATVYRSHENLSEIQKKVHGTLTYSELYHLEAWGASGDPNAVPSLIKWYKVIQEPMWAYSILFGLARSMDPDAHHFVLKTLASIDMEQMPTKLSGNYINPASIVLLLILRDPTAATRLLLDPKTASWAAEYLIKIPSIEQFDAWLTAVRQQYVTVSLFFTYLFKTWDFLPLSARTKACEFFWKQPVTTTQQWAVIATHCLSSKGLSPRWVALLGNNRHMLSLLKSVRDQPWMRLPPDSFFYLDSLLTEFSGQASWERILLEVLGQVASPDAVNRVASYALHNNLWLREQALSSLSMAAHPLTGRMLHAAALENAGEEAIAYFLPYLHHSYNLPSHEAQRRTLIQIAQHYLKSKEPSYVQAALLVLALKPEGPDAKAWHIAESMARDQVLRKDWKVFAGLLPILARFPQGQSWISLALSHRHSDVVLGAVTALAFSPNPTFVPRLRELVLFSQKNIAINAAFALARARDLEGNIKAAESVWWEVKSHAVQGLIDAAPHPRACGALLSELSSRHTTIQILTDVVSALLQRCGRNFSVLALKQLARFPSPLLERIVGYAYLRTPPSMPFFMRLVNSQHIAMPGKKFSANFAGHRTFTGFTSLAGVIFFPSVPRFPIRIDWVQ